MEEEKNNTHASYDSEGPNTELETQTFTECLGLLFNYIRSLRRKHKSIVLYE
jgi:hypothetical protein